MDDSETIGLNRKFEPRIGHKYIDLAEFVNEGKVRRKFLLERSKTNAMVTVSLDIVTTKMGIEFRKYVGVFGFVISIQLTWPLLTDQRFGRIIS
jgi:hypothetical protein